MSKWKLAGSDAAIVLLLVTVGIAGRLLWHPTHVAPVAATALFAGFVMRSRLAALCVPIVAMLVSDWAIGFYHPLVMAAVYVGMCVPILLGRCLRRELSLPRLIGCSLAGSMIFYALSNGAVWGFGSLYDRDLAGLATCYTAALPFLRNSVVGDLLWTCILFSAHGLLMSRLALQAPRFSQSGEPALAPVRK